MTPAQQPRHPLRTLTTAELATRGRELEHAVAFFGRKDPVRADLQARLADVLAERASRTRQRP